MAPKYPKTVEDIKLTDVTNFHKLSRYIYQSLFKQTRDTVVKSELVILLKANLVDKQYTDQQLEEIKQRYNQL